MGFRQIRTSDITGATIDDNKVITVVVRAAGKQFDTTAEEIAPLKRVTNVVQLELKHANGKTEEILVDKADFDKLVTADVLKRADSLRGRRQGYSPKNGG
ncbi:hypothetical protein [Sinomonas susongensis]|uniref:hypothetical protein n=1 Tax=Sinomonas susongensis TaxID=1324851 RepID=UPI00110840C3|nr:hypothetical protein [Sinomonas susongensis]